MSLKSMLDRLMGHSSGTSTSPEGNDVPAAAGEPQSSAPVAEAPTGAPPMTAPPEAQAPAEAPAGEPPPGA